MWLDESASTIAQWQVAPLLLPVASPLMRLCAKHMKSNTASSSRNLIEDLKFGFCSTFYVSSRPDCHSESYIDFVFPFFISLFN